VRTTGSSAGSCAATAAFDFDGTLTTRDCFVPFLVATSGRARLAKSIATMSTELLAIPRTRTRDVVKAHLARTMLRGRSRDELTAIGIEFGRNVITQSLRTSTLRRLHWHRRQGHCVVIVSSSLRFYLEPVAEALGVDVVLCTELEFNQHGIATGELLGANCRGQEKVNRLLASGLGHAGRLWAYGDSSGDAELLAIADEATWVRRKEPVRA
jgi:phosphatidylglycerophosphatase C